MKINSLVKFFVPPAIRLLNLGSCAGGQMRYLASVWSCTLIIPLSTHWNAHVDDILLIYAFSCSFCSLLSCVDSWTELPRSRWWMLSLVWRDQLMIWNNYWLFCLWIKQISTNNHKGGVIWQLMLTSGTQSCFSIIVDSKFPVHVDLTACLRICSLMDCQGLYAKIQHRPMIVSMFGNVTSVVVCVCHFMQMLTELHTQTHTSRW